MVFGHSMRAVIRDLAAVIYELSKLRSALIASDCLPPTPQLASRHAIYRLILEHEARRALHCKQRRVEQRRVEQLGCPDDDADGAHDGAHLFESVLFMRPDLAILVPLLPYCFHPLDTARRMGDWIVWMPRGALDGAFGRALDVFRSCAVRFERGSEKLFDELAASSNVSYRAREPPVQLVLPPHSMHVLTTAPPPLFPTGELPRPRPGPRRAQCDAHRATERARHGAYWLHLPNARRRAQPVRDDGERAPSTPESLPRRWRQRLPQAHLRQPDEQAA